MSNYYSLATWRNMLILSALWVIFYFGFEEVFSVLKGNIPDLMFHYTSEELYAVFQNWGSNGRSIYIRGSLMLDYLYPVLYATWLSFGIFLVSGFRKLALMPWMISVLDLIENVSLLNLLTKFPEWNNTLATFSGYITSAKWLTASIVLAVFLILIINKAFATLFHKQSG